MSEPTYTSRQQIKFYRVLLLNAALTSLAQKHRAQSRPMPPLRELSQEIKEYWRALATNAALAGTLADINADAVNDLLENLAVDLPQYR